MTAADPNEHPSCLTADVLECLPGVRHGFFKRTGGVSSGIYTSLNVGFGSDDAPEHVAENRRRAMAALDLPAEALNNVHQAHGRPEERRVGKACVSTCRSRWTRII